MPVIIDMDMPGACCACNFEWSNFVGDKVCMIVNTDRGGHEIDTDPAAERPNWCPLVELDEEGWDNKYDYWVSQRRKSAK